MSSKGKRTRTGCLCCRRRHKKCDEAKPSCKFCDSKGITCEWPLKGAVFVNYSNSSGHEEDDNLLPHNGTISTFSFTSNNHNPPSSLYSSTSRESSLDMKSPTAGKITLLEPVSKSKPGSSPTEGTQYSYKEAAVSAKSTSLNYNLTSTEGQHNISMTLPSLKSYHFVPRSGSPNLPPIIAPQQSKRLSVDSLLN